MFSVYFTKIILSFVISSGCFWCFLGSERLKGCWCRVNVGTSGAELLLVFVVIIVA